MDATAYIIRTWEDITYADGTDNAPADITETEYATLAEAAEWLKRHGFSIDGQDESVLTPIEALDASWLYNSIDFSQDYQTGDWRRDCASFVIRAAVAV